MTYRDRIDARTRELYHWARPTVCAHAARLEEQNRALLQAARRNRDRAEAERAAGRRAVEAIDARACGVLEDMAATLTHLCDVADAALDEAAQLRSELETERAKRRDADARAQSLAEELIAEQARTVPRPTPVEPPDAAHWRARHEREKSARRRAEARCEVLRGRR